MLSLFVSKFHFRYPAYGSSVSIHIDWIQRAQNAAVRIVFCLGVFWPHVSFYREDLNMLSSEAVCKILTNCMIHKTLTFRKLQYLNERLIFRYEIIQYSTRHSCQLHFPRVKSVYSEEWATLSLAFGPTFFNALPKCLKIAWGWSIYIQIFVYFEFDFNLTRNQKLMTVF